jgi:hypothetical protein
MGGEAAKPQVTAYGRRSKYEGNESLRKTSRIDSCAVIGRGDEQWERKRTYSLEGLLPIIDSTYSIMWHVIEPRKRRTQPGRGAVLILETKESFLDVRHRLG